MAEEKKSIKTEPIEDTQITEIDMEEDMLTVSESKESSFKGKYVTAIGRRKTSIARVRVYVKGKGAMLINDEKPSKYFSVERFSVIMQPLKLTSHLRDYDISIVVSGGGKSAQAEAIRHGISRALVEIDIEQRVALKARGWITRDDRKVERKKPGLKKARKAPQWSKR